MQLDVTYTDDAGAQQWVGGVCCGACGQPITDVQPPLGTEPEQHDDEEHDDEEHDDEEHDGDGDGAAI